MPYWMASTSRTKSAVATSVFDRPCSSSVKPAPSAPGMAWTARVATLVSSCSSPSCRLPSRASASRLDRNCSSPLDDHGSRAPPSDKLSSLIAPYRRRPSHPSSTAPSLNSRRNHDINPVHPETHPQPPEEPVQSRHPPGGHAPDRSSRCPRSGGHKP